MAEGLLVVVPNFEFAPGKWMGPNFLLSVLRSPSFRDLGVEVHVVSRGDRDGYCDQGRLKLHKVASASRSAEPFDRYGNWWSGQGRKPMLPEACARLRDAARVAGRVWGLLPRVRSVLWWTEPHPPFGNLVRAAAGRRGIRSVFTLANYQPSFPMHDALLRGALGGFDRVVAPCRALEQRLAAIGVLPGKLTTVPLGVDLERWQPVCPEEKTRLRRSYGVSEDAVVVLWFGPIIPPARPEDVHFLLEALPRVRRQVPRASFVFAFKYGVPHDLVQRQPWVRAFDRYGDVGDLYRLADVAAVPFTAGGPWITTPLSMLEAMACALPVVTLRRPCLEEVVGDGEGGLLVDRRDDFAEAVGDLCSDRARLEELSGSARRRAEREFDVADAARRYARLLLEG
ncbi:MAG: glycosyltransferase family 4 protein [Chloroflexi bacterium]|nr:glycosyltransferase family 4 protein [Chloroflexota bacterium]